jgi:hypothetical protein
LVVVFARSFAISPFVRTWWLLDSRVLGDPLPSLIDGVGPRRITKKKVTRTASAALVAA